MVGLIVGIMRGAKPSSVFSRVFDRKMFVSVIMAPALGMFAVLVALDALR